jgi:CheY-like chemotaxis protein
VATILVVDDRAINRQLLITLLGYYGHELYEAADGAQALELARAEHPDLIISDILMPTMDGVTFARSLRADPASAGIPVMFYTATYQVKEARALGQTCGVSVVLAKPSSPAEIIDAVYSILGLPPPAEIRRQASTGTVPLPAADLDGRVAGYIADLESVSQLIIGVVERGRSLASEREGLTRLAGKLRETVESLHSLTLRLAALVDAGIDLSAQHDPVELLQACCRAAQNICVAKYAGIGARHHFVCRGIDPASLGQFDVAASSSGILAQVLKTRRPHRARGLDGDARRLGLPAAHPAMKSFLAVPLASPTTGYGWLYVGEKLGAAEFSDDDERVALTLAAQAAMAYENALLLAKDRGER